MLFKDDKINISEIFNVRYNSSSNEKTYHWPGTLFSYELIYYAKGTASIEYGGKHFDIQENDILYLPKNIKSANYIAKFPSAFAFYDIMFDTDFPLPKEAIRIQPPSKDLLPLFKNAFSFWLRENESYFFNAMSEFYRIIALLRQYQLSSDYKKSFSLLAPSEEYMTQCFLDINFSFTKLAELSGLSYSHFKRLFIAKYTMPPVKYISQLKIRHSEQLLLSKKYSISEVAAMCGYKSTYYFSAVFKKSHGCSPSRFVNNSSTT